MNEKALKVLEYHKIIEMLNNETESSLGKMLVEALQPSGDLEEVQVRLDETDEAVQILLKRGNPPFGGMSDCANYAKKAVLGGMLDPRALLRVSDNLRVARKLKKYLLEDTSDKESTYPILQAHVQALAICKKIEDEIEHAIIGEEEIADDASPQLKSIRRNKKIKLDGIRSKLNGYLVSHRKYLQDALISVRGDRYVIPVRAEYKSSVPGIVHDQSSTGATLFIEPSAIVELNNQVRALEIEENKEIERILRSLSALVAEFGAEIIANQEILMQLDFIYAKGRLALKMDGHKPKINDMGLVDLRQAKHPLIPKKVVVANDITLGEGYRTLVITGPNTGGKTVTLKTLGLLTLMMQSGLCVPAELGSNMAVYSQVFADIGDEQSIEQSLSTFSSHMTNIVKILDHVDTNSLVLFDELGAGTDPVEGAALAIAILTKLYKMGVSTMATTHYSELKLYALSTEGVQNASVEFDVNSLRPTYRLLTGIPGKSNAFEISKRLGLGEEIIQSAKEIIADDNLEFESVLDQIERDRVATERNKADTEALRAEIESLKSKLKNQHESFEKQREKLVQEARYEAKQIMREAKEEADAIIKDLREIGKSIEVDKEKARAVEQHREKLNHKLGKLNNSLYQESKKRNTETPKNLQEGEMVMLINHNQEASVLALPDKEGYLMVQAGIMKLKVHISEIKQTQAKEKKQVQRKMAGMTKMRSKAISLEKDIRGLNVEDAYFEVDKYLDDAYLSGLKEVTIIHGKGTGALRSGIQDILRSHRHVEKFRGGEFNEGGLGVTVVTLR